MWDVNSHKKKNQKQKKETEKKTLLSFTCYRDLNDLHVITDLILFMALVINVRINKELYVD